MTNAPVFDKDGFTVADPVGTDSRFVVLNDAPAFDGKGFAPTYHAGDGPIPLVHNVLASDIDSDNYAGGSLTAGRRVCVTVV